MHRHPLVFAEGLSQDPDGKQNVQMPKYPKNSIHAYNPCSSSYRLEIIARFLITPNTIPTWTVIMLYWLSDNVKKKSVPVQHRCNFPKKYF